MREGHSVPLFAVGARYLSRNVQAGSEGVFNVSGLLFQVVERPERDAYHSASLTAECSFVHVFVCCECQLDIILERKAGHDTVLPNPYLFGILMKFRRCKTLSIDTASSNYVRFSGRGLI